MTPKTRGCTALATVALLTLAACGGDSTTDTAQTIDTSTDTTSAAGSTDAPDPTTGEEPATGDAATGIDTAAFFDGALVDDVVATDCTLGDGTETSCYELTIAGFPANRDSIGPWCPATTSDDASDVGIWFDGSDVYDIDGQFILDLADIYGDTTWKLYYDEGNVLSTDTSEKFNDLVNGAPADPDAGAVNLCVYGEIEWADGGGPIAASVEIPVTPVVADTPSNIDTRIGVTLDGVLIEGSAPIDLILGNYTIGAFDPCGGHVNPQEGYHMHATTGCSDAEVEVAAGETAMFGYALDGFAIHAPYDDTDTVELDGCNGHTTDELGYHYHANPVAENAVLPCFSGLVAGSGDDAGAGGPGDGGPPPAPEG